MFAILTTAGAAVGALVVVEGHGQERGNSGVYPRSRYEVQVLDSYDNVTYSNGQARRRVQAVHSAGQREPPKEEVLSDESRLAIEKCGDGVDELPNHREGP